LCTAACWAGIAIAVLIVPLLALIPGLLAAASLSFLTPDERAAAAGGFGFAFLGLSAFVAHLLLAMAILYGLSLLPTRNYWNQGGTFTQALITVCAGLVVFAVVMPYGPRATRQSARK